MRKLCTVLLSLCVLSAHAFIKTSSKLMVTTQAAILTDGKISMPPDTDSLLVEVGCSDLGTLDEQLLDRPEHGKAFLVSVEPMLDKFAVLLSRGTKRFHKDLKDRAVPLGKHHARGVVLPFAIAEKGGPAKFHVSSIAGCSSLLKVDKKTKWASWCTNVIESRTVDTMQMDDLFDLLPDHLPIKYFKLDVQGMDGRLIKTIPLDQLKRIEAINFEATTQLCDNLYDGQMKCEEVQAYLESHGFEGTCKRESRPDEPMFKKCEVSPVFRRKVPKTKEEGWRLRLRQAEERAANL